MNDKSGIYLIINLINEKFYVGSTNNFVSRWTQHKSALNRNIHASLHLQAAWNIYGEENFKFYILEFTENLLEREQYWIDKLLAYNKEIGYNTCLVGRSQAGIKRLAEFIAKQIKAHTGVKHTEESKRKIAEAHKGKKRKPFSDEWKANLSKSKIGNKYRQKYFERKKHVK